MPNEIVEFNPENDDSAEIVVIEDDSDVNEIMIQQSHKKIHLIRRNLDSPQGGGSKTRKILACQIQGMSAFM